MTDCTCSRCVARALARKHGAEASAQVGEMRTPMWPCLCGGSYGFAEDDAGKPMVMHSLPYCERFEALETTEDAVNFSRANRKVA